jgi:hypothetical protein
MVLSEIGESHTLACVRVPVAKCPVRIPQKWIESLEQNQLISSCCRHPENHDIEAWYSSEADRAKGIPDIYKFHCTCGRAHVKFCVGGSRNPSTGEITHPRPFWEIR